MVWKAAEAANPGNTVSWEDVVVCIIRNARTMLMKPSLAPVTLDTNVSNFMLAYTTASRLRERRIGKL